jgi:hypothetical protein
MMRKSKGKARSRFICIQVKSPAWRSRRSSCAFLSPKRSKPGYMTTATSCPGERWDFPSRQHSRTRRRARFLATALGYERTGTKTTLLFARALDKIWIRMPLHEKRFPRAKIFSISARFRTLSAFLNPCPGIMRPLPRGAGSVRLLLVGGGQLAPTLSPSPLEDESAPLGFHPGSKAEFTGSAHFTWLISTFHFPGSLSSMGDGDPLPLLFMDRRTTGRFNSKKD